jgi:hypothetical protein
MIPRTRTERPRDDLPRCPSPHQSPSSPSSSSAPSSPPLWLPIHPIKSRWHPRPPDASRPPDHSASDPPRCFLGFSGVVAAEPSRVPIIKEDVESNGRARSAPASGERGAGGMRSRARRTRNAPNEPKLGDPRTRNARTNPSSRADQRKMRERTQARRPANTKCANEPKLGRPTNTKCANEPNFDSHEREMRRTNPGSVPLESAIRVDSATSKRASEGPWAFPSLAGRAGMGPCAIRTQTAPGLGSPGRGAAPPPLHCPGGRRPGSAGACEAPAIGQPST